MATYKVIQDIEAEDKLVGPLSLRQFIYTIVTIACLFLGFKLAMVQWFLALPFIPPAVLFGFLAAPFGHDQPSEVWLLARIRFALKPRRRIWDQSGMKELVTVTAPKKLNQNLTNGLSQTEVKSRLSALANTIDSRGWAVKNVGTNMGDLASDRLVSPSSMLQGNGGNDADFNDVLDETKSPTAQHFQQMMDASAEAHKSHLMRSIKKSGGTPPAAAAEAAANPWFGQPIGQPAAGDDPTVSAAIKHSKLDSATTFAHMRKLEPETKKGKHKKSEAASDKPLASASDPAIIELANNDDLNVATIARQANKASGSDEVVISLH